MIYNLSLTQEQLTVVANGLEGLPWKVANPIIAEINSQLSAQLNATTDRKPSNDDKKEK